MTTDPIAEAISSIEARWPEAVERAKNWQPGMMRSAWTTPLDLLVGECEHVIRELGDDPNAMVPPKSMRADSHEKALPDHVRGSYRRGAYLRGRMASAHKRAVAKALKG